MIDERIRQRSHQAPDDRDADRVERAAVVVTAVVEHARRAGIGGRVGVVDAVSDEQHVGGLELEHGQVAREDPASRERITARCTDTSKITKCGLRELVVIGKALTRSTALLNRVAEHVI